MYCPKINLKFVATLVLFFCTLLLPAQLRLIYNETFVSNKTGWPVANETEYSAQVANGAYTYVIKAATGRFVYIPVSINPNTYFILETRITTEATGTDFAAGLVWNVGSGSMNTLKWYANGSVSINKRENDTDTDMGTETSAYTFTDGKPHILKIKSFSNRCEVYIDDHLVKKTSVKMPYKYGNSVGVCAYNKGTVHFDYIKVYQEREEINLPTTDFNVTTKENLRAINTAYDEVQPVISHDGHTLYFVRKNYPQNINGSKDDIYYSNRDASGNFSTAQNLGKPVNNSSYNSVVGFSADEKKMIVNGKYTASGAYLGDGFCEFTKTDEGWANPKNLDIKNYYNNNTYCETSYSPDGNALVFTIERRDTHGGKDVYISLKQPDGTWSAPFNAGPVVNSFADEISPFIAGDNKTLYFASEGHSGYGGADVFMTHRLDDTWKNWSKPVNMGPKINSADWDAYFTVDAKGEWAYMVSTHQSVGRGDIFRFKIPQELKPDTVAAQKVLETLVKEDQTLHLDTVFSDTIRTLTEHTDTVVEKQLEHKKYRARVYGKVYDAQTKQVMHAVVYIRDLEHDKEVYALMSDEKGFEVMLDEGLHYSISTDYMGYYAEEQNLDLTTAHGDYEKEVEINLKKIEKDQTITLNNIFFVEGSSGLRYDSRGELTHVASLMKAYPKMVILIGGHTSMNHSTAKQNRKLSEQRAKAVYDALLQMGVDKKRLQYKGFGHDNPAYDVNVLWENAKNRRVDFTIVSM